MGKQSKKKSKKNDDGSMSYHCNVTNNFDWTFVPGVRKVSTNHAVKRYFDGEDLFDEIDVAADGNCLFYAFQLFTEWSVLRNGQASAPAFGEPKTIATFRRSLRQGMQDSVRRDANCYRGIIGNAQQVKAFMKSVYDPWIPDVDYYYNRPRDCLPESTWGTEKTLYVLGHQYYIHRVVIFTSEGVSVASLSHILDGAWRTWSPEGHLFLDEGFDNNGICMSRVYHDLIHPHFRSNSHYTLYVYFTGNHYHWLKPKNALKMPHFLHSLVTIGRLQQFHRLTQATSNCDNDDHGDGDESKVSLNSIHAKAKAITKNKAGSPVAATSKPAAGGLTLNNQEPPIDQAWVEDIMSASNTSASPTAKSKVASNHCSNYHKCIICLERTAVVCCVPCGHVIICQACNVPKMASNLDFKCPTCRHWISQMIQIYF
jgi:hypothetical protein